MSPSVFVIVYSVRFFGYRKFHKESKFYIQAKYFDIFMNYSNKFNNLTFYYFGEISNI